MIVYASLHTLIHLFATFPHMANLDQETFNKNKQLREQFDTPPTYAQLLFTTFPGITGLLLLLVTLIIGVTSIK